MARGANEGPFGQWEFSLGIQIMSFIRLCDTTSRISVCSEPETPASFLYKMPESGIQIPHCSFSCQGAILPLIGRHSDIMAIGSLFVSKKIDLSMFGHGGIGRVCYVSRDKIARPIYF
jgi:hypothetical protein